MKASLSPLPVSFELPDVLRQAAHSHRALAELKGAVVSIPNETILIDTLALQDRGLQAVRESDAWEAWVLYMLRAVEQTSRETFVKVRGIRDPMRETKLRLRSAE